MKKSWTGKKEPTNPVLKEQHQQRKTIKEILHHIEDDDWEEQLKEYYVCEINRRREMPS